MSTARLPLWRLCAASVAALCLLAACTTPSSVRIDVTPGAAVLNRGGQVTFTVTVTSATASGPFTLSAGTLPSGVTAMFEDATLAGAGDSTDMTLTATPDATAGTVTVTVSASGAGAAATDSIEVTIEDLDVTGVVTGLLGEPLAGVSVLIDGHTVVTSAADGSFAIDDVTVPYDITFFRAADGWAHRFDGLSTGTLDISPLPALTMLGTYPSANITGNLDAPVPAGHQVSICAEGIGMIVYGCTTVVAANSAYDLEAYWAVGSDANVRLRAVEYEIDAEFDPVALTGTGAVTAFDVTEGGNFVKDLSIAPGPVNTATFDVTVVSPFAVESATVNATTILPSGQSFSMSGVSKESTNLTAITPVYSGSSFHLTVQAQNAGGQIGLMTVPDVASSGAHSVEMPLPSNMVTPADAATNVGPGTDFTITGTPGRVNTFYWSGSVVLAVTTSAQTSNIPDLADHGLPLPASANFGWAVLNSPDHLDVDADAETGGMLREYFDLALLVSHAGPAPDEAIRITSAGNRNFTTAP